ncbi:carbohydrate ABC transporter permease [Dactylosporangium sp. CA-233914]|uniref:carbohydrate ABC transporter permease n=1 Tax=Dactylosporangium sp. CA-233914 TaxID=3239934 RepID=UPI003D8E8D7C
MHHKLRHALTVASFMAPATVGIVVFFLYPLVSAVYFSFTKFDLLSTPEWVGLRNYRHMFADSFLATAARNTLWCVIVMVPARMLTGLASAMLLTKLKRGSGWYRTIFYLPALAPPVAATLAFVYLLKPGVGPVNTALAHLGLDPPLWFNSPDWSKPSLVLLCVWGLGDVMVLYLAALLDVPVAQHEAAALDGANAWQRFRHVTLPHIRPVVIFTAVIGVIQTLQYFTQAAVAASAASGQATTGAGISSTFGYPEGSTFTYPLWLYVVGFRYGALGYANALAVVLFVVALGVSLLLLRRTVDPETAS